MTKQPLGLCDNWMVAIDHPYYPEIDFYKTEEEAVEAAREGMERLHSEEGHHKLTVTVAKVSFQLVSRSDY